jgi:phosphatidylethanolamine-binding protein (PEBP) family uncharacterized protein
MKKLGLLFITCFLFSCTKEESLSPTSPSAAFEAYSSTFTANGEFPQKYTCDGASISPALAWKNPPAGTKGYAITMHHIPPTGDKHVYMCVYNIASSVMSFPENSTTIGLWGINTVNGKNTYTPPCSQGPGAKIYVITVYALSEQPTITLAANKITMDVLLDAISTKTLAKSVLSVSYTRP